MIITWSRFLTFFLVVKSISILMLTLVQMVIKALTFIAMTVSYIIVMIPVFQILF